MSGAAVEKRNERVGKGEMKRGSKREQGMIRGSSMVGKWWGDEGEERRRNPSVAGKTSRFNDCFERFSCRNRKTSQRVRPTDDAVYEDDNDL